jgi:hypothetical protein
VTAQEVDFSHHDIMPLHNHLNGDS